MNTIPAKFDRMVIAIKASLRKSHPNWSSDKVESVAFATARVRYRETYGTDPLKD